MRFRFWRMHGIGCAKECHKLLHRNVLKRITIHYHTPLLASVLHKTRQFLRVALSLTVHATTVGLTVYVHFL